MARRLVGLAALAVFIACTDSPKPKGEIIVEVQTDVALPDSVDRIRIEVSSFGSLVFGNDYDVGPSTLRIPATLGVLEGADPSTPALIRLIARKGGKTKMLREITTTVPADRVATLRIPIRWLCDDSGNETSPGEVSNAKCPAGQTCIAGDCHDANVDSGGAATYSQSDVFGGGTGNGDGTCFDVVACMEGGTPVTVDPATCTFAKPAGDPAKLNVALQVSNDGICDAARGLCFVILDRAPLDGWQDLGDRVQLPHAVCDRLASGRIQSVVTSEACATKTERDNVCGPWSSVGVASIGPTDAGADATTDGGAGQALVGFPPNSTVSGGSQGGCAMRLSGNFLFFCMSNGMVHLEAYDLTAMPPPATPKELAVLMPPGTYYTPWIEPDDIYWMTNNLGALALFDAPTQGTHDPNAQSAGAVTGLGPLDTFQDVSAGVDMQFLYIGGAAVNPSVYKIPRGGGAGTRVVTSLMRAQQIAVVVADGAGTVYVGSGTQNADSATIESAATNQTDGTSALVATLPKHMLYAMALDGSTLYAIAGDTLDTASVYSVALPSGPATEIHPNRVAPGRLVVDGASLYWAEGGARGAWTTIVKAPKTGGAPPAVIVSDVRIDALAVSDSLYYSTNPTTGAQVKRAPK